MPRGLYRASSGFHSSFATTGCVRASSSAYPSGDDAVSREAADRHVISSGLFSYYARSFTSASGDGGGRISFISALDDVLASVYVNQLAQSCRIDSDKCLSVFRLAGTAQWPPIGGHEARNHRRDLAIRDSPSLSALYLCNPCHALLLQYV